MNSIKLNPVISLLRAIQFALTGRIHFPKEQIGNIFVTETRQRFKVFRYVVVDPGPGRPQQPGAVFVPHFHVAGMSVRQNIRFSLLPIPFYIGLPGFRSKRWLVDEVSGDFAGYYEWDSVEDAENYSRSFAARFMLKRSIPETVWFRVYPIETAPAPPQ